jgi:hypothetical protein
MILRFRGLLRVTAATAAAIRFSKSKAIPAGSCTPVFAEGGGGTFFSAMNLLFSRARWRADFLKKFLKQHNAVVRKGVTG